MGYVENGTESVVKIFQDEATKDYVVKVRGYSYYDRVFSKAIDQAYEAHKQEF